MHFDNEMVLSLVCSIESFGGVSSWFCQKKRKKKRRVPNVFLITIRCMCLVLILKNYRAIMNQSYEYSHFGFFAASICLQCNAISLTDMGRNM